MANRVIADISIPGDEGFPIFEVWAEERDGKRYVILTDVLIQQHTYIPEEYADAMAHAFLVMANFVAPKDDDV